MITINVNKTNCTATTEFDGKTVALKLVKVNKAGAKPTQYWIDMQKLGTPKRWQTIYFSDYTEDNFSVNVDELAFKKNTKRISTILSLTNLKDYLTAEDGATFDELMAKAKAELDVRTAAAQAKEETVIKEKKASKKATLDDKIAILQKRIGLLQQVKSGEIPMPELVKREKKVKKDVVDIDAAETPAETPAEEPKDDLI